MFKPLPSVLRFRIPRLRYNLGNKIYFVPLSMQGDRRKLVHWTVKSVIILWLIKLTDPFVPLLLICFVCCRTASLKTRDKSVWWAKIIPRSVVSDSVRPKPCVRIFGNRQLFCLFRSGSRLPTWTMAADFLAYLVDAFNLLTDSARGGRRRLSLSRELNSWPFQFRPSLQSPVCPGGRTSRHKGAICFSFPAR